MRLALYDLMRARRAEPAVLLTLARRVCDRIEAVLLIEAEIAARIEPPQDLDRDDV